MPAARQSFRVFDPSSGLQSLAAERPQEHARTSRTTPCSPEGSRSDLASSASAFSDSRRRICPRPGGSRQCWRPTARERSRWPYGVRILKVEWMPKESLPEGGRRVGIREFLGHGRPRPCSQTSADRVSISAPAADPRPLQTAMGEAGAGRMTAARSLPGAHRPALHAPAVRYDPSSHESIRTSVRRETGNQTT